MKALLASAALAAAIVVATPAAAADFTGPRVGATIGTIGNNPFDGDAVTWGVEAGYDMDLGSAVVGVTAEYQDDFEGDGGRELAVVGRVGARVGTNALVYATAGYSNVGVEDFNLDGVRVGVGVEANIGESGLFVKAEQRYANYELGAELYQTVAGVGFRF